MEMKQIDTEIGEHFSSNVKTYDKAEKWRKIKDIIENIITYAILCVLFIILSPIIILVLFIGLLMFRG